MKILIAKLKLHNFLTLSSSVGYSVIGGVTYTIYRPQPYLHNYALMYGFAGLLYASLASSANPEHPNEIDYSFLEAIEKKIYAYPARPRHLVVKRMLCNVKSEGYAEPVQPHPKSMYPWHVAHVYFAPGSIFETVIIVKDDLIELPRTIRVGVKRQGVFKVEYTEAKIKDYIEGISDPINLGDVMRYGVKPDSYVLVLTTKTKRMGVPYSNYVVKGLYRSRILAVIEGRIGGETIEFRLPMPRHKESGEKDEPV